MIAENVDFFLEDLEDLADRCHIKEEIDGCLEHVLQGILNDTGTHVPLVSLDNQVAQVAEEDLESSVVGCHF